jgi:hypothetical protein
MTLRELIKELQGLEEKAGNVLVNFCIGPAELVDERYDEADLNNIALLSIYLEDGNNAVCFDLGEAD